MTQQVIVIGAGIGGLAAALALARQGARVRIIERAGEIREVGAGSRLGPTRFAPSPAWASVIKWRPSAFALAP